MRDETRTILDSRYGARPRHPPNTSSIATARRCAASARAAAQGNDFVYVRGPRAARAVRPAGDAAAKPRPRGGGTDATRPKAVPEKRARVRLTIEPQRHPIPIIAAHATSPRRPSRLVRVVSPTATAGPLLRRRVTRERGERDGFGYGVCTLLCRRRARRV